MSASDVARSQRILDKVGSRLGLTEGGKQWLIAAVDPFHDTPLNVCGYPDNNEAASVLQIVKCSAPIVAPAEAGAGNWDCHIHQFLWMAASVGLGGNFSTTTNGNGDQATGYGSLLLGGSITTPTPVSNSNSAWGGLSYDAVASTQNTFQYFDLGEPHTPFAAQLKPYLTGEYRVVAMGFEVINTTSELNIQGLCTVYRQPCADMDSAKTTLVTSGNIITSAGATSTFSFGYADLLQSNTPPANTGEALLLEGSRQWKAKEGCYVVPTFNSSDCPTGLNNTTPVLHVSNTDSSVAKWIYLFPTTNLSTTFGNTTITTTTPPTTNTIQLLPTGGVWMQPFNHSGAYFTGLSNSTTLQLNATYYIERFPTQQDSALVVLARNSCHGDHIALDLYSEIIKEMPVGVPQRMNGLGEWFADAVSTATDFISPVLSAIPLPMAQAAGAGLKTVGNIAKSLGGGGPVSSGNTYSASGAVPPMAKVMNKQKKVKQNPPAPKAKAKKKK